MSKEILIELTPIEPYFLGDDRTTHFREQDLRRIGTRTYFIRSERLPSQTTLFGILRYLGIKNKTMNYDLGDSANDVGPESFRFNADEQTFGKIKCISPLFIINQYGQKLVRTPVNHIIESNDIVKIQYTPFNRFWTVPVTDGKKTYENQIIPLDYNSKDYLTDSFMDIKTGAIIKSSDLFYDIERTGIDTNKSDDAYFKMLFVNLKEGCRFAFYATLDDDFPEITDRHVYMGRRKSAMEVAVTASDGNGWKECTKAISRVISNFTYPYLYCASDIYLKQATTSNPMDELLSCCIFSVIQTTTVREFITQYTKVDQKERFTKSNELYRLIEAGSVLYPAPEKINLIKRLIVNQHFRTIGMNCVIEGGKNDCIFI